MKNFACFHNNILLVRLTHMTGARNPYVVLRASVIIFCGCCYGRALVLDIFHINSLSVSAELGVLEYLFYTSGASSLTVSLHIPHKQADVIASLGDISDVPLQGSFGGKRCGAICRAIFPLFDQHYCELNLCAWLAVFMTLIPFPHVLVSP